MSNPNRFRIPPAPLLSHIPSNPIPGIADEVPGMILGLHDPDTREEALHVLAKNRTVRDDMGVLLWFSFGIIALLLQEIITVFPLLSKPELNDKVSHRLCNVLVLIQVVATHPESKKHFMKAKLLEYIRPLFNHSTLDRPHEYIRLTSLGVIGALVKNDNEEAVHFVIKSGTFPCILKSMKLGAELTKTVAAFILNRILSNAEGLQYCIVLAERFYILNSTLGKTLEQVVESGNLAQETHKRLLKHIIWCYYSLSTRPRPCDGLRLRLPEAIKDPHIINALRDDQIALEPYLEMLRNIANGYIATTEQANRFNSRSGGLSLT